MSNYESAAEKLAALRKVMETDKVDHLLVVSDDYHQSEYVGDFFKSRAYISGFTGSAGTLVISMDSAKLFTDGRYHIQAERQIAGSGIDLMRSGTEGVPTVEEYLGKLVKPGETLAFDGRCVSAKFADKLKEKLPEANFRTDTDYPALIWPNRPVLPSSDIWSLGIKYAGKTHSEKLAEVKKKLAEEKCASLVMSSLCDIAWFYNLRGNDVEDTPVFLAYSIITPEHDYLFVNEKCTTEVKPILDYEGVEIKSYDDFYKYLPELTGRVMVDKSAVNSAIVSGLSKAEIVDKQNPTLVLKAIKNDTELANIRKCHIADGLAVTKLMIELKYGERELDEVTADDLLWSLREECADKIGVTLTGKSFGTIAAFAANAAMMHYSAKPDSAAKIDKTGENGVPMLLVDSGGHYLEGTTDITRTFVLGPVSDEVKMHYTLTAVGNLRLANLVYLDGAAGSALDVTCREPLWEHGIDYRCGTGHGVGYLLSVHEGPNRFHWKNGDKKLEVGMVTTDEPGVYVEGSHGIRIENELVTVKGEHNEYGQFLKFENITYCPIDLDGIDTEYMEKSDIKKLNDYHKMVFDTLSPYLCEHDREKLAYMTRNI